MKPLTQTVLDILKDTIQTSLFLSEELAIEEFTHWFEEAVKERDEYCTNIDKLKYADPINEVKLRQKQTL